MCGQKVEVLNTKPVIHEVTARLEKVNVNVLLRFILDIYVKMSIDVFMNETKTS
jgi:hypothetical protein